MIVDKQLQMSAAQAVTASAASTDYIDQGAAGDALGGQAPYVVVRCHTTADSAGDAATVTVMVETDDESGFTNSPVLLKTAAIAQASVVAGAILLKAQLPPGAKRYIRVYYTIGTENLTAGKFDAFLVPAVDVAV